MREASIKIKKYAENVSIINNNAESAVLRAILFAFGAVALWYVLVLGNIVLNIIERKTAEVSIRSLTSEVGDLELEYLTMSNNVDLNLSYKMGFKELKPVFAVRKSLGSLGSISLARNEI